MVQEFYNLRRKAVIEAKPNEAHFALAELQDHFNVQIITQNIDDLHERAGSKNVLHLHGEIKKSQSTVDANLIYDIDGWELKMGEKCELGSQLRPFIVWFGEAVPKIEEAAKITSQADIFIVVGTSLVVYPAAGLLNFVGDDVPVFIVDPGKPTYINNEQITFIQERATTGVKKLIESFLL